MLEIRPPARADFDSDAAWGRARALYFKNLPQRKRREPQIIEVIREVPVEVIREVEVVRQVEVEAQEIEIPAFLRSDPVTEFIVTEMRAGESMAEATDRLRLELEILLNRAKDGPLSEESEARKRELTSGLGKG